MFVFHIYYHVVIILPSVFQRNLCCCGRCPAMVPCMVHAVLGMSAVGTISAVLGTPCCGSFRAARVDMVYR